MRTTMLVLTVPLALLAACQMKVGKDDGARESASLKIGEDGNVAIHANDGADGVSVSVPGFEGKMKVPGIELGGDHMDIDGMKLYPGTKLHNIDVTDRKGAGNGQVDMRFTSPDTPEKIAAYYAAAASDEDFTNINVTRSVAKAVMTATKSDGDRLTISMDPGEGGTTGRILLEDARK